MRNLYLSFLCLISLLYGCNQKPSSSSSNMPESSRPAYAIVIHGGAGYQRSDNHSQEKVDSIHQVLNEALDTGEALLKGGSSALDAVIATINILEDSPHFNAGKGAVFTHDGKNELDASIMDGATLKAGAAGGVTNVKNPITLARAIMDHSEHVMMVGKGAETFAAQQGLDIVDPSYFYVQERYNSLQRAIQNEEVKLQKYGTVGCVALDHQGNIAAGTSTGGMTNKRYNRIGDSPIIGAGTYADNQTCGVSSTGHGEYFIRLSIAKDISSLMEYGGKDLMTAADTMIHGKLTRLGGTGGVIAMDAMGNIAMPFNTDGMYRGYAKPGERKTAIFKED